MTYKVSHISQWAGTDEFLAQRNKSILWSTWCSTNLLEMLMLDSHNICADDLSIYRQRKSSSALPLLSTVSHTSFEASFRQGSSVQPLMPRHYTPWGKVQVEQEARITFNCLQICTQCSVTTQGWHCCCWGGPPRIKATKFRGLPV